MEQPDALPQTTPPPPPAPAPPAAVAPVASESRGTTSATPSPQDAATTPTVETHYHSTGVWPAVVGGLVIAAIVVIFVAQNTHNVLMHFLWTDFRMSPGVLVLATGLVAVAASIAAGAAWRVRRRQILAEREELVRLRETAA